jgi:membrane-associated phospholipid phosphatase
MSPDHYRDWRWAPPVILYGWSTFVAWTRIQAYRHYVSDVVVGALAGYLIAELFFSLNDNASPDSDRSDQPPIMFRISIPF